MNKKGSDLLANSPSHLSGNDDDVKTILDFEKITELLEYFYHATGVANFMVDLNGKILFGVGWKSICADFHRKGKCSSERCLRSDTILANKLLERGKYAVYLCENGMVDAATPIVIDDVHIANLYIGQFFFEEPDKTFFIRQAEECGFDPEKYMTALGECKVYPKDSILRYLDFLSGLTRIIGESTLKALRQQELLTEINHKENELLYLKNNLESLVEQRTTELKEMQMLLKSSLESPKDMIILSIDKDYNYYFFNQAHHDAMLYAYGKDVDTHSNLLESITNEEDKIKARTNYAKAMDGLSHATIEKYGDVAVSYYETFYNPVINDRDEIVGATAFSRDVTERLVQEEKILELNSQLESRVQERTAQLLAVNKELEAFSYSVSHDLKAPLRHITGFVSMLEKKQADTLSEEGRHYLGNIAGSAKTMGELIDGLLRFSRNGRVPMNRKRLNMNEIVMGLIRPITEQEAGWRVEWSIGTMPRAYGDEEMLKSVWGNLIDNAVKFSRNKPQSKIVIGSEENESELVFHIWDNGAGFDMDYSSKLFEMFQRLHDRDEFEGTGIGLAMIRRIITRHGGRTWAEGKVGEGATFYFSLPKERAGN